MVSRRLGLAAVVVVALLVGAGGMWVARWVRSPEQAAVDRQAPPASLLTAMVEFRVLDDQLVLRGDVVAGGTVDVTPSLGEATPLVTGVRVKEGDEVGSGDVLVEVGGRPLVVWRGRVPAYRDIRPGSTGQDVKQLQVALRKAGFSVGADKKGRFGSGTKRAVADYYDSLGVTVPTTGDEDLVKQAEQAVTAAERAVVIAERTLTRALKQQKKAAKAAKSKKTSDTAGAVSEDDQYAVSDAEYELKTAKADLVSARAEVDSLTVLSGPMVPLSEIVFAAKLPARVLSVNVSVGDLVEGPVLSLATGALRVICRVDAQSVGMLSEGMAVEVYAQRKDVTAAGVVDTVGEYSAPEEGTPGHDLTVAMVDDLPEDLVGANVRVTVVAASSGGPVLVVPLSAVTASADGTMSVSVVVDGTVGRRVVVTAGMSGAGFVEVKPVDGQMLSQGDLVVVGQDGGS